MMKTRPRIDVTTRLLIAGIFLVLGVKACNEYIGEGHANDDAHLAGVQNDVKRALKDPDSAQFRDMERGRGDNVFCGYVNARTEQGGYAGFTRFLWIRGEVHIDANSPVFDLLWNRACGGMG